MQEELVSVTIPTLNSASTLTATLDSVARQTYNRIELIIADGNSRDETAQIATDFGAKVIQTRCELFSKAHPSVVPSIREGYGIVIIEANACGTPAIGWDVPGLRDSIVDGETGILVPFDDTQTMAKQIVALLKDGDTRERMGASAMKWARSHTWEKSAEDFDNVLSALWG